MINSGYASLDVSAKCSNILSSSLEIISIDANNSTDYSRFSYPESKYLFLVCIIELTVILKNVPISAL